ncbi:XRE family transcriptional regulator [Streptacidiphilus sp. PAMC 29251]
MTSADFLNRGPCSRLAAELRLLRERSGLTIAALAEESAYSRSSWQRYLSGSALPPWLAVRALCHLADEPEPRIRALWELAEGAWSGRGAVAPAPAATPTPAPAPVPAPQLPSVAVGLPAPPPMADGIVVVEEPRRFRRGAWGGALAGVLLLAATLGAAAGRDHQADVHASVRPSGTSSASGFHVGCVGGACNGLDPQNTLCGVEPQTLLHQVIPGGTGLEVRYNPLCRSVWARIWNTRLGDVLTLSEPGAPTQKVSVKDPHALDAFAYTPLLALAPGGTSLKACLTTPVPPTTTCFDVPSPER